MGKNEFLSLIKSKNATLFPKSGKFDVSGVNINLQKMHAATLPTFLQDLYSDCNGITLTTACIFGPQEQDRGLKYPLPSIIKINEELSGNKNLFGKTIFGRNDLFLFAFDSTGTCYMLDNINLSVLRKYDNPYQAMTDCLIVGKI